MNRAYLLTGGNLGNRIANLHTAKGLVNQWAGKVVQESGIYETAAWGLADQPAFLNQVLVLDSPLSAQKLLEVLLHLEQQMGRLRLQQNGPRLIDIDILFFNDEIIQTTTLSIPHPRLHVRKFSLIPLFEINPGLVHPVLNQTIAALLSSCPDRLNVQKYSHSND